jgi:hypothetical protein
LASSRRTSLIRENDKSHMLFSALSTSGACTPTLYSYLVSSSIPLTYFCGHLLDINKIILYLFFIISELGLLAFEDILKAKEDTKELCEHIKRNEVRLDSSKT